MSGFDSNQFKRKVPVTQPMQQFVVGPPDEEFQEEQPDIEELKRQAREQRQAQIQAQKQISGVAKQRIEYLANIGRLTKEVPLAGITFTLRTLKAKETREAALATFGTNNQIAASFEARKQQLARSLFLIDGQDIAFVLGKDDLETRLNFVEDLEESMAGALFNAFTELKDEAGKAFDIKSEADAKEVADGLKK